MRLQHFELRTNETRAIFRRTDIRTRTEEAPYVFGTQKCVSNESDKQCSGVSYVNRRKNGKKIAAERGRQRRQTRIPIEFIRSLIGINKDSSAVKNPPPYSVSTLANPSVHCMSSGCCFCSVSSVQTAEIAVD